MVILPEIWNRARIAISVLHAIHTVLHILPIK